MWRVDPFLSIHPPHVTWDRVSRGNAEVASLRTKTLLPDRVDGLNRPSVSGRTGARADEVHNDGEASVGASSVI